MTYISPKEELNEKYKQFKNDIKDIEGFTNKIDELAFNEISNIFPDILTINEEEYLQTINNGLKIQLSDIYTEDIFSDKTLMNLIDNKMADIRKRYLKHYNIVKDSWDNYQIMIKEKKNLTENYLVNYRKHCEKSDDYAYHSCGKRNCSKFLIVKFYRRTNMPKYVLCLDCKKVYITKFISCHCNYCNEDYYSSLLERNEDKDLLLATWKNYHCEQIINDRMKCILCHYNLFLNMQTGMLQCINSSCKFTSKQENILWTCSVDKVDFKSKAKVYSPLEIEIARKIINQILIIKHRAHPNRLGCNCKLNIFFTEFLHKKDCSGVLYYGEFNNKIIIVCGKCKAVNFYERFIWTCPKCGTRFRDKKGKMTKENLLLKSQNETRFGRIRTLGTEDSELKDDIRKKNLEAYTSPTKRKRVSTQKETLNELIEKRKSIKKDNDENNEVNKSSVLFRNKTTTNFNNDNPLAMSQQFKIPKRRVLNIKDIEAEENNNRYDNDDDNKPITRNRFGVRHSVNYLTQSNNHIFDDERAQRFLKKKSKEMDLCESDYPKYPNSPSSFRRRKEKTKTDIENLITLHSIGEKLKENTKKSRLESKKEEEMKKQQEKEEQEKREKERQERQERREKREKERKEREEREEKERIQKEKEKKEREAQREKIRKEKEKERQEKREKERKEREEREEREKKEKEEKEKRYARRYKNQLFGDDNEDEEDKISLRKKVSGSLDVKKDHKKYLRYDEDSNKIKEKKKKSDFGTSNSNNSKEIMKFDDQELEETKSTVNLRPSRTFDQNMVNKEIKRILSKGKIPEFRIEDYHIVKQLGEGSYGVIYRVVDNKKNAYAMKKLIAHDLKEVEAFHKEFEFVSTCKHKNIMKVYGAQISCLDFSTFALYVLMEIAAWDWDSDIKKHLQNRNYYKEEELIIILKQLVSALYFMQAKKKVAHRDIKPQNVLVFNDNGVKHFKVADFGEAKEVKISKQLNTLRGTELYMSPALYDALKENVEDVKHNAFKSDVFSLGFCFIYASSLNFNIIYDIRDVKDMNKIEKILMRHLKNKYTNNYIKVLCLMLETDENKRFDFIELYKYIKDNFGDPDEV